VLILTIPATAGQIDLGMVPGVLKGNHLKLGASRLERHQEEHSLGIEGGVDIPALAGGSHPIEHPEGGVIEVSLGFHVPNSSQFRKNRTVRATQASAPGRPRRGN